MCFSCCRKKPVTVASIAGSNEGPKEHDAKAKATTTSKVNSLAQVTSYTPSPKNPSAIVKTLHRNGKTYTVEMEGNLIVDYLTSE
jgi:hypothetical protein